MAGSRDNGLRQQSVPQSPQGTAGGGAQSADMGLSQALEQQLTQAIQPALDEFRQRMAEVSDQMAAMPIRGAGKSDTSPEAQPQQREAEQATESQPQPAPTQAQPIRERLPTGVLSSAVQTVERHSAQWLQSLLVAGLGALLAEPTREAVQQRAEQALHTLLQKAFDAAPADFANQELREKTERTLQFILREALDAVFAEGVRASVQQGGQQIVQQSLRGDFGGALRKVEETLQVMLAALIAALRQHQQTIIRLCLALMLLAVASSLEQSKH